MSHHISYIGIQKIYTNRATPQKLLVDSVEWKKMCVSLMISL